MKKLILGSAIAILTVLFVSLIVCICVICRQNKKIKDLEAREPEIKYVEVEVEVEVERTFLEDHHILEDYEP